MNDQDESIASVYAALANDNRLRCLNLVVQNSDVCVCEAVAALGISQPVASKAMSALKSAGLLEARRDANWTYYSMQYSIPPWLKQVVKATAREMALQQPFVDDQQRFESLALREKLAS